MLKLLKSLTPTQWIILYLATAGVINGSAAQLTEWFGPNVAHDIISVFAFSQTLIGAWAVALTGQGAQIKSVLAMPGVENIDVNAKANPTLAAIAVDPALKNIAPLQKDEAAVAQIAKG